MACSTCAALRTLTSQMSVDSINFALCKRLVRGTCKDDCHLQRLRRHPAGAPTQP
jgi:hypothetical protein